MATKIHMVADSFGRPLRFILTAGQVSDVLMAPALVDGFETTAVLAASPSLEAATSSREPARENGRD